MKLKRIGILALLVFLTMVLIGCADSDSSGGSSDTLDTYNSQNTTTWEEGIGYLLPSDYPKPVSYVSITSLGSIVMVYIYGLESESQINHIINKLQEYYEKYPEDTFENTLDDTESGDYYYIHSLGYTATHTSDPAHEVTITTMYTEINYSDGWVLLMYDFSS